MRISFRGSIVCSITRFASMVSVPSTIPRRSMTMRITSPMDSDGVIMRALRIGSEIVSNIVGSGICRGLSRSLTDPSFSFSLYTTPGLVEMMSRLNSRRRRSCTISMWSRPRNPQRKPKPRAKDDSWWNVKAESLRWSFSSPCSTFGNSSVDIGYIPQKTVGWMSWNPGSGSVAPRRDVVTVSPILISLGSFTVPTRYPTCPASSLSTGFFVGEKMPVS